MESTCGRRVHGDRGVDTDERCGRMSESLIIG